MRKSTLLAVARGMLVAGPAAIGTLALGMQSAAAGLIVNYSVAATGQTATADFTFTDGDTLVIVLTETTAASSLTGADAVLTRLGFHLPGGQIGGGAVAISPGSASVGFNIVNPQLGGGADVSTEWGYSQGSLPIGATSGPLKDALLAKGNALIQQSNAVLAQAEELDALGAAKRDLAKTKRDAAAAILSNNPDPQMKADAAELIAQAEQDEAAAAAYETLEGVARAKAGELRGQATDVFAQANGALDYDFVGVLEDDSTPFETVPPGGNLDDVDGLGGARGGLLADADARDGLGIIDESVTITLNLTNALDDDEQAEFLRRLLTDSVVEYGDDEGYGTPTAAAPTSIPTPASLALLATGLAMLGAMTRRRAALKGRPGVNAGSATGR